MFYKNRTYPHRKEKKYQDRWTYQNKDGTIISGTNWLRQLTVSVQERPPPIRPSIHSF